MKTIPNTYFFPINSENLGAYFLHAIIAPASVFQDRAEDIQNKFEEFLVLSTKHSDESSNCTLELILTEAECTELNDISAYFKLFPKLLPITRVKQIIFDSEEQLKQTVTSIGINTAFIPENIVSHQKLVRAEAQAWNETPKNELADNNKKNVDTFDRLLGAFALMKIATQNTDCNYSLNYFSELSKLNSVIEKYVKDTKVSMIPIEFNITIKNHISSKFDDKLFKQIAAQENQKIIKDQAGIVLFEKLKDATYIASILRYYKAKDGELGTHNIDTLILNNFSELKEEYAEEIAFLYGYNRGYSSFTKEYTYSGKKVAFKYKLDSLLDYYTIESIYHTTINKIRKTADFAYLDNLFPKLKVEDFEMKISESFIEFKIFDTIACVPKKKENPQPPKEDFWGLFSHFLEKTNLFEVFDENSTIALKQSYETYLTSFVTKNPIIEKLNSEIEKLFKKIEALEKENETQKIKIKELSNLSLKLAKEKKITKKSVTDTYKQTNLEDTFVHEPTINYESESKK